MMIARRFFLILLLVGAGAAAGSGSWAPAALADGGGDHDGGDDGGDHDDGGGDDHERARGEILAGRIAPLSVILRRLREIHGGKVLDVRLRGSGREAIYVIRVLDRRNRLRTLRVRAGTGRRGRYRTNFRPSR